MSGDDRPLILTVKLDASSFDRLDGLRRRHFPPALNHLSAHLTLFHKLDGGRLAEIVAKATAVAKRPALGLQVAGLRRLGRGVAFEVRSPELASLRAELAQVWSDMLTPQDRQGFRPHVTVQNKVQPDQAAALADELTAGFTSWSAVGEALLLWRYLGGPWSLEAEVPFTA